MTVHMFLSKNSGCPINYGNVTVENRENYDTPILGHPMSQCFFGAPMLPARAHSVGISWNLRLNQIGVGRFIGGLRGHEKPGVELVSYLDLVPKYFRFYGRSIYIYVYRERDTSS